MNLFYFLDWRSKRTAGTRKVWAQTGQEGGKGQKQLWLETTVVCVTVILISLLSAGVIFSNASVYLSNKKEARTKNPRLLKLSHKSGVLFPPSFSASCLSVFPVRLVERKRAAVKRCKEQLLKMEVQATDREENKQIALGTSKLNYLDPRISVAWWDTLQSHSLCLCRIPSVGLIQPEKTNDAWGPHLLFSLCDVKPITIKLTGPFLTYQHVLTEHFVLGSIAFSLDHWSAQKRLLIVT